MTLRTWYKDYSAQLQSLFQIHYPSARSIPHAHTSSRANSLEGPNLHKQSSFFFAAWSLTRWRQNETTSKILRGISFSFRPMFAHGFIYFTEIPFRKQPAYIFYWDNMVTDVPTKAAGCLHRATQDHAPREHRSQLRIELVVRGPCSPCSEKADFLLIRGNPCEGELPNHGVCWGSWQLKAIATFCVLEKWGVICLHLPV